MLNRKADILKVDFEERDLMANKIINQEQQKEARKRSFELIFNDYSEVIGFSYKFDNYLYHDIN